MNPQTTPPLSASEKSFRSIRTLLLTIAALITLVAVFYTVENWRGKLAWESCKRQLEAKGEVLDWKAYIPPPIADEQNIFKAPKMAEWFVGRGPNELSGRTSPGVYNLMHARSTFAQVIVVSSKSSSAAEEADLILNYDRSLLTSASRSAESARDQLGKIADKAAEQQGDAVPAPKLKAARGYTLSAGDPKPLKPVRILLRTDKTPKAAEIAGLFGAKAGRIGAEAAGSNSFRVYLNSDSCSAADYLMWSDQLEPEFELIREALKRPYAQIDCRYDQPYAVSNVNFVTMRIVGQTLAERAQCHLLLRQPDKALEDLTLLRGISRLLQAPPSGRPVTLVAAMINVALSGLYVGILADGFDLKAWQEPQLAALQEQLQQINLGVSVLNAFRSERAGACYTFETTPPPQLANMFILDGAKTPVWEKLRNPRYWLVVLAPRGWLYQNMAAVALTEEKVIDSFDPATSAVVSSKAKQIQLSQILEGRSPYNFLAGAVVPNFVKAVQTEAATQTQANEAFVACALERYRLAHGQYPESLNELVPHFAKRVPLDMIDGEPLRYRRRDDGQFLLYSLGWNERDDGGKAVYDKNGRVSLEEGDWVWGHTSR